MRAELPLLEAHGLTMWGYIVLTALRDSEVRGQASLADVIGADRTRIIAVLDDLQNRELIIRRPDPDDRRSNLLSLTAAGRKACNTTQAEIQENDNSILKTLPPADRAAFLRVLDQLSLLDSAAFKPTR